MTKSDGIVFQQKADQTVIKLVCLVSCALGFFFLYKGSIETILNWDLLGGAAIFFAAGALLFLVASGERSLTLLSSALIFEQKSLLKSSKIEVPYLIIKSVGLSEYLGSLEIAYGQDKKIVLTQYAYQISGPSLESLHEHPEGDSVVQRKMKALAAEIQGRVSNSLKQ